MCNLAHFGALELRPFDPQRDVDTLRAILLQLKIHERLSSKQLLHQVELYVKENKGHYTSISRDTLDRFKKGGAHPKTDILHTIWEFLQHHTRYCMYFKSESATGKMPLVPSTPEGALSLALTNFFTPSKNTTHLCNLDYIRDKFCGQYVMYRPDLRPVALKLKHRSGQIRASIIDIFLGADNSINICETQDFLKTENDPSYYQQNSGVMFPYGKYIIFIMKGVDGVSFKTGVIHYYFPFACINNIEWFRGTLFVASHAALFPSAKFFCLKNTHNYKTGIITLDDIPNEEVKSYLSDENDYLI